MLILIWSMFCSASVTSAMWRLTSANSGVQVSTLSKCACITCIIYMHCQDQNCVLKSVLDKLRHLGTSCCPACSLTVALASQAAVAATTAMRMGDSNYTMTCAHVPMLWVLMLPHLHPCPCRCTHPHHRWHATHPPPMKTAKRRIRRMTLTQICHRR